MPTQDSKIFATQPIIPEKLQNTPMPIPEKLQNTSMPTLALKVKSLGMLTVTVHSQSQQFLGKNWG